jgi:hypothetical protein
MRGAAAGRDPARASGTVSRSPAPPSRPLLPAATPLSGAAQLSAPPRMVGAAITDADPDRAEVTRLLISALAPRLGLRVEDVRIRVDGHADGLAGARGARGLMAEGTVHLRPQSYDPRSVSGRRLLGHEVTHLAQRAERHLRPDAPRPDAGLAEEEADRIGRLFAETGAVELPRAVLPAGASAADIGVASAVRAQVVPAGQDPEEATASIELLSLLGRQVRLLYKREVARFGEILDAWWLRASLVDEALAILQAVEFPVAAAIASTVPVEKRARLLGEIGPDQRRRYQRGVLAYYTTLGRQEFSSQSGDLLAGFDLYRLDGVEKVAVVRAIGLMSEESLKTLLEGEHREQVLALTSEPLPPAPSMEEMAKLAAERLADRIKETAEIVGDKQVADTLDELNRLLAKPSAADAARALDLIARYRAPEPKQEGAEAAPVAPSPVQAYLVTRLDRTGAIGRLIEALPAEERLRKGARRDAFLLMLRARSSDLNIALSVDLLSYHFLDWAVRDKEARLAYDIVKQMAPADQYRFRHLDGGKWYARLIGNLPDELVQAEDFEGVEIARGEAGDFIDIAGRQRRILAKPESREIVETVMDLARRGFDAKTAVTAYEILTHIGAERLDPRTGEENRYADAPAGLLQALVRRMDTFGYFADMVAELPDRILFDTDRLPDTQRIMRVRDPAVLEREARDLLGDESLTAVVTARDAWLSFQLIRALPPSDRAALEAYKGGKLWSAMTGEMTPSMQESLSFSFYAGGAEQRDKVRMQLRDATLWGHESVGRLRTFLRMAVALGDHRWAFEQSRLQAAHEKPWLEGLRHEYRLYDPKEGRSEYRPEVVEGTSWYQEGVFTYLAMIVKGVAFLANNSLLLARETIGTQSLDLVEAQSVMGGTFGTARLEERDGASEPEKRDYSTDWQHYPNYLDLRWDVRQGLLGLRMGELRVAAISHVGAGFTLKAGRTRLSRLDVEAGYTNPRFERPAYMHADMGELVLEDVLVIMAERIIGIERISIRPVSARMGATGAEEAEGMRADNPALVPVPILWPFLGFVGNLIRLWAPGETSPSSDLKQGFASMRSTGFSIGALSIEGLSTTDGQNVASITARDIDISIAGNRPAYLRALIASLSRRILERRRAASAAGKEADVTDLEVQKAAAQEELGYLKSFEREYLRLQRKRQADPDNFTPEDLAYLREVEAELLRPARAALLSPGLGALPQGAKAEGTPPQAARGGAVFDIGSFKVSGVSGLVDMDDVELGAIHGEGQSALLAMEALTDGDLIRRIIEEGPPAPDQLRGMDASEVVLEIGRLRTSNVTVRGTIPPSGDIRREMATLPDTAAGRQRREALAAVLGMVEEYEALSARAALPPSVQGVLSAADQQRLVILHAWLGRHFGIRVGSMDLGGTALTADLTAGRYGFRVADVDVRNVESDAYSIDAITGRNVSGGIGLPGGMAGFGQAGEPASLRAGAERLDIEGTRLGWAGDKIDRIGLGGFRLDIRQTEEGYAIDRFALAEMTVEGLDLKAGGRRIWSSGRSGIFGVEVKARVKVAKGSGPLAGRMTGAVLDKLFIQRIEADRLGFEDPSEGMRVEVESGALGDIWAKGIDLAMPADGSFSVKGDAGIDSFDALKFSAAMGRNFASGTVSSAARADGVPGSPGGAIAIGIASADSQTIAINHLALTGGDFRTENGRVRVRRLDVSAEVARDRDRISVRSFDLHELTVPLVDWRTASGAHITANGPATIKGLSVKATVTLGEGGVSEARVERLRVRRISAADIRYVDPPMDVHIRPKDPADPQPPLEITGIEVDGIRWSPKEGVTSGKVSVDTFHTEFAARLAEDLKTEGRLDANRISVELSRGGRIVGRVQDVTADLSVDNAGTTAKVSVTGLDTGEIEYDGKGLSIGAGDRPGLKIESLSVDGINFVSAELSARTLPTGVVTLNGIGLKLGVEFVDPKDRKEGGSSIRRILIRHFRIDHLFAKGLNIGLAKYDAELELPADTPSHVFGIELTPRPGDEAFTLEPNALGEGWETQGTVATSAIDVRRFRAAVANKLELTTDFSAEGTKVDLFKADGVVDETSGMVVELKKPTLSNIEGQLYGRQSDAPDAPVVKKGRFLLRHGDGGTYHGGILPGIGADRIQFAQGGRYGSGKLEIEGFAVRGLVYEDPVGGIRIDVKEAKAPSPIKPDLDSDHYFLPDLVITDAAFSIGDIAALLSSAPTASVSKPPFDIQQLIDDLHKSLFNYRAIFDSLSGPLQFDLGYEDYGPFSFKFGFNQGRINYAKLESGIFNRWGWEHMAGDLVADFELDSSRNQLVLEADLSDIVGVLTAGGALINPGVALRAGAIAAEHSKIPLVTWDLGGDFEVAENEELVNFFDFLTTPQFTPTLGGIINDTVNAPPEPGAKPVTEKLSLHSIFAQLSLTNPDPITIPLGEVPGCALPGTPGPYGSITLEAGAMSELTARGDVQKSTTDRTGALALGLKHFKLRSLDIRVPTDKAGAGAPTLEARDFHIQGVEQTTLHFKDMMPAKVDGIIRRASVRAVTIYPEGKKEKAP